MTNLPNRFALGATALTVAACLLLWLAMLLGGTSAFDHAILVALYAGERAALADAARLVTMIGDWRAVSVAAAIAALVLVGRKQGVPALVLLIGIIVGRALTELQKFGLHRARPDTNPHLVEVHNLSFPSGHSANAMMTYVAIALLLAPAEQRRSWVAAALIVAAFVGFSRVMLGVHWPSDILGGWAYGLVWALLLAWVAQTLKRKSSTSPS